MIETKSPTQEMIDQLNAAEEVLAALDQAAGSIYPIARACRNAYLAIEKVRDEEAEGWNDDPDETVKIYRCQKAGKHYHTDADGPCEVWSTEELCGLHQQLAIEQAARDEARAEYHRAKRRGDDV